MHTHTHFVHLRLHAGGQLSFKLKNVRGLRFYVGQYIFGGTRATFFRM